MIEDHTTRHACRLAAGIELSRCLHVLSHPRAAEALELVRLLLADPGLSGERICRLLDVAFDEPPVEQADADAETIH